MKPITLTADPALAKVAKFHDLNDGRFAVETVYDAQAVVDYNAAVRAANKKDWKGENLVGRVPMPMWQQLQMVWRGMKLSKEERHARLLKLLADPDYADFKVKAGRI